MILPSVMESTCVSTPWLSSCFHHLTGTEQKRDKEDHAEHSLSFNVPVDHNRNDQRQDDGKGKFNDGVLNYLQKDRYEIHIDQKRPKVVGQPGP